MKEETAGADQEVSNECHHKDRVMVMLPATLDA